MLRHWNLKQCLALATVLLSAATQSRDVAGQVGCRPQTPCPCAADGVCLPKRETWGHYHTRWRTWPGEPAAKAPTGADDQREQPEDQLPPFVRPRSNQEDLRGPAKPPKAASEGEDANVEPGTEPGLGIDALPEALPGVDDALPAFDPLGEVTPPPSKDDAPPALPAILQQISATQHESLPPKPLFRTGGQPMVRANVAPLRKILLVNPAAAVVAPEDDQMRRAIYVEATDLDE